MASEMFHEYHRDKCESFARKAAIIVLPDATLAFDVTVEYYVDSKSAQRWERVSVVRADGTNLTAQNVLLLQTIWRSCNGQPDQTIVGANGQFEVI